MSASNASILPSYYFIQSPYLNKEMESCIRSASRASLLAQQITPPRGGVHRLRRGDMLCSFLVDERTRLALGEKCDRVLNANGKNSPAFAEADKATSSSSSRLNRSTAKPNGSNEVQEKAENQLLSTPTQPLLLYWTDGAKRSLPFSVLRSVSIKRGASRAGAPGSSWETPDRVVSVFGGSNALNCKLLDDKCQMQRLLAEKPYVPFTRSFDITKAGWQDIVASTFSGNQADPSSHQCLSSCERDYLIIKPSLGLKQHGILILPRCAKQISTAIQHVSHLERPGGLKGIYETWVIQQYLKNPLCISGLDIGLLFEEGEALKANEGRRWKQLLSMSEGSEETKENTSPITLTSASSSSSSSASSASPVKSSPTQKSRRATPAKPASSPKRIPSRSPEPKAKSVSPPVPSPSTTSAASSRQPSIIHTLSASTPYLPSDSSHLVHMLGLFKLHFRVFAMVHFDSVHERYEVFCCNLVKVYHATEAIAHLKPQQSQSQESHFQQAAAYFLANKQLNGADDENESNEKPVFTPLSSLPSDVVTLSPSFASPHLNSKVSVSKYLAMRLAHHIFPPHQLERMLQPMFAIIVDCIQECVKKGGMFPCGGFSHPPSASSSSSPSQNDDDACAPGLSERYFQFLGYDFLWDTETNEPVLLEINNNVGQGLMKQEVMSEQKDAASDRVYGHSNEQYGRMRDYWRDVYRVQFVEGTLRQTLDRFLQHCVENDASPAGVSSSVSSDAASSFFAVGSSESPRLMSTPPKADENCWILASVFDRKELRKQLQQSNA